MSKSPKKGEAARPKAGAGDAHDSTIKAKGGDETATGDPEFSDKMRKAKDIVTRYRNTLRTLAK